MRRALCLGMLLLWLPSAARPQIFGGATEWTQIANRILLAAQYSRQAQQLQAALNLYYEAMRAGKILTHMQWSDAQTDILNLAGIINASQDMASDMSLIFTGYSNPRALAASQRYATWATTTMATIQRTMQSMGMSYTQLRSERSMVNWLQRQSATTEGQHQALQVANAINVEELQQIQKLRLILTADSQATQAYQAYNLQKDMTTSDFDKNFYGLETQARGDGRKF